MPDHDDTSLVVETTAGPLRAAREGSLTVCRGVPYAEPPVGERRWRAAEAHAPWTSIREATRNGPIAVQSTRGPFSAALGDPSLGAPMSEDCLTLTLWTPGVDDARRPVLVWIHGGGFITGAGSWDVYSGESLAQRGDVVVVGVNYRTGPLGFLHLGDDDAAGGNFGLTDLICALQWTRDNVAGFGGDPEQITLFGQSAGAWSILAMLGLPDTPRVRGAIVQSPVLDQIERPRAEALKFTQTYMDALGVASVDALRRLSAAQLLQGLGPLMPRILEWGALVMPFRPTIDGRLIRGPIVPAFIARAPDIPLALGWTRREMSFFFAPDATIWTADRDRVTTKLRERYGDAAPERYREYAQHVGDVPSEVLIAHAGNLLIREPARRIAEDRARQGLPTWVYELEVELPALGGRFNGAHCSELPFVFDSGRAWHACGARMFDGFDFARATALGDTLQRHWLSLAHDGRPEESWEAFDSSGSVLRLAYP
jgi:carboxylesterase type B